MDLKGENIYHPVTKRLVYAESTYELVDFKALRLEFLPLVFCFAAYYLEHICINAGWIIKNPHDVLVAITKCGADWNSFPTVQSDFPHGVNLMR